MADDRAWYCGEDLTVDSGTGTRWGATTGSWGANDDPLFDCWWFGSAAVSCPGPVTTNYAKMQAWSNTNSYTTWSDRRIPGKGAGANYMRACSGFQDVGNVWGSFGGIDDNQLYANRI